jgi:hypothetical protein
LQGFAYQPNLRAVTALPTPCERAITAGELEQEGSSIQRPRQLLFRPGTRHTYRLSGVVAITVAAQATTMTSLSTSEAFNDLKDGAAQIVQAFAQWCASSNQ